MGPTGVIGMDSAGGVSIGTTDQPSILQVKRGNAYTAVGGNGGVGLQLHGGLPGESGPAIIPNVASSGTLNLGSSTAHTDTLIVSDVFKNGSANYVEIQGGAGLTPLFIAGAQGSGGGCYIHPDCTAGSGELLLGSDNVNTSQVRITNTAVTAVDTLFVTDVPYLGSNNYVEIKGGAGLTPLFIAGAQGSAGACYIFPNCSDGSGSLNLGSDISNTDQITITNTNVTVRTNTTLDSPPYLAATYTPSVQSIGTVVSGAIVTLTNPSLAGLYAVMIGSSSTDPTTIDGQASCIAYYNGSTWNLGGTFFGGIGYTVIGVTQATKANLYLTQTTGNSYLGVTCVMIPLFQGPITGAI